ncbi:hypothetical protein [Apibacter adventoris]|uniref:hypothetical protein n=1 Tax=Apibacter adventoris TaxID=1679466 RepID=UPI0015E435F0|nr:hypothetical protein [Apibacter adventoris]
MKKKQNAKATSTSKTNEKLVLEKFKVEELEKRYEMGWGKTEISIGIEGAEEPIIIL